MHHVIVVLATPSNPIYFIDLCKAKLLKKFEFILGIYLLFLLLVYLNLTNPTPLLIQKKNILSLINYSKG